MTYETELLRRQEGVIAAWQLAAAGRSRNATGPLARDMTRVHDGVYVHGYAPITDRQRWWAAVLTAPGRYLFLHSAAAAYGFRRPVRGPETVVAAGSGGPVVRDGLALHRSTTLAGHVGDLRGLPITSPARTLVDLTPLLSDRQLGRAVRTALREGCVTCPEIQATLWDLRGRKAPRRLAKLAARYANLQIDRTRSDPEAYALALLDAAGVEPPLVNVLVAGREADLVWPQHGLIIELDGGHWHQFPDVDEEKAARWSGRGGMEVRRFRSEDVYTRPAAFLALAPPPSRATRSAASRAGSAGERRR